MNIEELKYQRKLAQVRRYRQNLAVREGRGKRRVSVQPPDLFIPLEKSRKCQECGVRKPLKWGLWGWSRSNGTRGQIFFGHVCSVCVVVRRKKSPESFAKATWHGMKRRVEGKNRFHRGAVGKSLVPKEKFIKWSLECEEYRKLHAKWVAAGYWRALTPSIDRVNSKRGYELGNLNWLAWRNHLEKNRLEFRIKYPKKGR